MKERQAPYDFMPDGYLTNSSKKTLGGLELRCPPLPQTLVEAMGMIENPDQIDVGPVSEMVQRDPVVVARLLHIVNSAYYGLRHTISSAERAVVMLGPVAVAGIVAGMNMMKLHGMLEGPASQLLMRIIQHSLATGFLSRHLLDGPPREKARIKRTPGARSGVSFTAGLLHDFGKIILVYNFPREAVAFYHDRSIAQQILTDGEQDMERLLFGYDHTEAGEFVARKLNFPDNLTNVIRLHHDPVPPGDGTDSGRLTRVVVASNLAAHLMEYDVGRITDPEAVRNHPVWEAMCEHDLHNCSDPAEVLQELVDQREHVDQYVQSMSISPQPIKKPIDPRSYRLRTAI